jgi:hypothetical protein
VRGGSDIFPYHSQKFSEALMKVNSERGFPSVGDKKLDHPELDWLAGGVSVEQTAEVNYSLPVVSNMEET